MESSTDKIDRLQRAQQKVQDFVEQGGDLRSPDAVDIGIEFIHAANEVARELGYEFIKKVPAR